jgi:chromate transporter
MMEDEVVKRRQWLSHDRFLDLLGATNLIPGPNSTEMALHIGYLRSGLKGLLAAGVCFILPAVAITLGLAHLYVAYGSVPQVQPFLAGIRPAVIAVILAALYRLGTPVMSDRPAALLGVAVAILNVLGYDEILLLLAAGLCGLFWRHLRNRPGKLAASLMVLPLAHVTTVIPGAAHVQGASLTGLGLYFLKIGSILYGSGYVLVAFLQSGLVDARHWLTQTQLFDAIAVGQYTPGPVLTTATFIGYLLLGLPGAAVATAGIFLPSFAFVLISNPFIPTLRASPYGKGFLDGVNAAALGLMLAVTVKLASGALAGPGSWVILIGATLAVILSSIKPAWILAGAALAGWLFSLV